MQLKFPAMAIEVTHLWSGTDIKVTSVKKFFTKVLKWQTLSCAKMSKDCVG